MAELNSGFIFHKLPQSVTECGASEHVTSLVTRWCFDVEQKRGDTHKEDEVEEEQEVLDRRHAAFSHDAVPADTQRAKQTGEGKFRTDSTLTNAD